MLPVCHSAGPAAEVLTREAFGPMVTRVGAALEPVAVALYGSGWATSSTLDPQVLQMIEMVSQQEMLAQLDSERQQANQQRQAPSSAPVQAQAGRRGAGAAAWAAGASQCPAAGAARWG